VSPFTYNPVQGVIRYHERITLKVYANGTDTVNIMSARSARLTSDFISLYENHFLNFRILDTRYPTIVEQGTILVICYSSFMEAMQPYINWKNQKGIKTIMVPHTTAGTTASQIQSYIANYYNTNPDLAYVQLVGDNAQIPTRMYSGGGSDPSFGMFIPTHISYFTMESLKNLMWRTGYRLLNANLLLDDGFRPSPYNNSSMRTIWKKRQADDAWDPSTFPSALSSEQYLDLYLERSQMLLKNIMVAVDRIPDNLRLAVYCLSNDAALLFSSTNLGRKNIVKFYDQNRIYHGRRVLGREVGPFSRADAEANRIEALLISSYTHQPSIIKHIKDSGLECDIITLYL
jgi:hypothetical protein